MPNLVRQPTDEYDLVDEDANANFEGVMQRTRSFESVYQPAYQISGLFGVAGR